LFTPHTQDNLYANSLIDYLLKEEHFLLDHINNFGIACPANIVLAGRTKTTSYIMSFKDLVVGGLRLLMSTLTSNVNLPLNLLDPLGHNIIDVYLSDTASRNKISQEIHASILEFTGKMANESAKYQLRFAFNLNANDKIVLKSGNRNMCLTGMCT